MAQVPDLSQTSKRYTLMVYFKSEQEMPTLFNGISNLTWQPMTSTAVMVAFLDKDRKERAIYNPYQVSVSEE